MQKNIYPSWRFAQDILGRGDHTKARFKLGLHILGMMYTLILISDYCRAEVRIINKTEYYTVSGKTLRGILSSIRERSPFTGEKAHSTLFTVAYTEFNVGLEHTLYSDQGTCWVANMDVDGGVYVILPKHIDITLISDGERRLWKEYLDEVIHHEEFHRLSAIATAYQLEKSLKQLPTQKTCAVLHEKLKNTTDAILFNYRREQAQYDKVTYGMQ